MAKKKLKIAFISFYSGDVNRGVESLVHELSSRLSKRHNVTLYQNGKARKGVNYKIKRVSVRVNWNKKDMLGTIWRKVFTDYWSRVICRHTMKILPSLIKGKYDIIIPLNGGWQSAMIRLITWIKGSKMVIAGQSGIGWDDRNNLWCFPNRFIALTKFQKDWASKINPLVKITIIPNGTSIVDFDSTDKGLTYDLPGPIVLTVGALSEWKRIDLAIRAVANMGSGSLVVVGSGPQKDQLEKLCNKLIPDRYKILSMEYEEMPKVYPDSDLFTYPTIESESFGIVMVEAMASGLGVVATDDPIRREIVGNAGIFVDPTDTDAYSKALKKALKTKWGDKPRRQAEKYSWDEIAQKYEKLFLGLVDSE